MAVVVVAVLVLGLAAVAGTGRLGELPPAVDDRPRGRVPEGPVDREFLAGLRIPLATVGYDTEQVDSWLDAAVGDPSQAPGEACFDVRRRGYDMQLVDLVVDRIGAERRPRLAPYGIMGSTENTFQGLRSANGSDEAPHG